MSVKLECSFCGKEITKDVFNISVDVERQNIPKESKWDKSNEIYREYICPKCYNLIILYFRHIVANIRKNKGEYKPNE